MICKYCNKDNTDETSQFCNACGKELGQIQATTPVEEKDSDHTVIPIQPPNSTPYIIFSVINIVLCGSSLFGIIALVFSILATSDKDYVAAGKKLKISLILNIIGILLGAILIILFFVYFIFLFFLTGISVISS